MAEVLVVVCDHCGTQEGVARYVVRWGDAEYGEVDLCLDGAQPIREVLALPGHGGASEAEPAARPKPRAVTSPPAPRARRSSLSKVTTMSEIEAAKHK